MLCSTQSSACSESLLEEKFLADFNSLCKHKSSCLLTNGYVSGGECKAPESRMFVQFKCEQSQEEIDKKMLDTKTVLMIELFCTLLILAFIAISHRQTRVLADIYNGNNIKTEDYTLFLPLSSAQMDVFDR